MMMKWYSFRGPCGARLVYMICFVGWHTTRKVRRRDAVGDVSKLYKSFAIIMFSNHPSKSCETSVLRASKNTTATDFSSVN
jgi:DNA repair protein RadC